MSDDDQPAPEAAPPPPPKRKKASKAVDDWFSGTDPAPPAAAADAKAGTGPAVNTWDDVPPPEAHAAAPMPAADRWETPENHAHTDAPSSWTPAAPADAAPQPTPPPRPAPGAEAPEPTVFIPAAPKPASGRVEVGSVLNGIYRVTRFIARGGMGEVFEGENINSDERVAIKVILEHLSKDANVLAMFRKEAKTLTRLSHPALVQYRVLAQEPSLQAFYIVTEFIDGAALSDVYRTLNPSPADLTALLRRLAQGLEAAHELGAVHRDISLDNILLPQGRLDQAKIIDFGIAKDLDQHSGTIVGDGFAGKLGYVAPEQFGAYDRLIGPWTDVYSLALVMLAVAGGKPYDMGATLVEAIGKRQSVPDLSVAPEILRPLLAHMLEPDPKARLRSMTEVLTGITHLGQAPTAAKPAVEKKARAEKTQPAKAATVPPGPAEPAAAGGGMQKMMPMIVIGGLAAVVVVGGGLFLMLGHKAAAPAGAVPAATAAATGPRSPADVRLAVANALAKVDCSWVDVTEPQGAAGGQSLTVSGVAGNVGQISRVAAEAAGSGVEVVSDVQAVQASACGVIDSFRKFRTPLDAPQTLTLPVRNYTMLANAAGCPAGDHAKVVADIAKQPEDYTLLGMESQGWLQQVGDKALIEQIPARDPQSATLKADGTVEINNCVDEKTFNRSNGLQAVMLINGKGPFTLTPLNPAQSDSVAVPANWSKTFEQEAQAKGWRTEMAWFHITK